MAEVVPLECPGGKTTSCAAFTAAQTKRVGPASGLPGGAAASPSKCLALGGADAPLRPACAGGKAAPRGARPAVRCIRVAGLRNGVLFRVTVQAAWGSGRGAFLSTPSEARVAVTTGPAPGSAATPASHGGLQPLGVRTALDAFLRFR